MIDPQSGISWGPDTFVGRLPGQEGPAYFNTGKDGNYFGGALMVQTAKDVPFGSDRTYIDNIISRRTSLLSKILEKSNEVTVILSPDSDFQSYVGQLREGIARDSFPGISGKLDELVLVSQIPQKEGGKTVILNNGYAKGKYDFWVRADNGEIIFKSGVINGLGVFNESPVLYGQGGFLVPELKETPDGSGIKDGSEAKLELEKAVSVNGEQVRVAKGNGGIIFQPYFDKNGKLRISSLDMSAYNLSKGAQWSQTAKDIIKEEKPLASAGEPLRTSVIAANNNISIFDQSASPQVASQGQPFAPLGKSFLEFIYKELQSNRLAQTMTPTGTVTAAVNNKTSADLPNTAKEPPGSSTVSFEAADITKEESPAPGGVSIDVQIKPENFQEEKGLSKIKDEILNSRPDENSISWKFKMPVNYKPNPGGPTQLKLAIQFGTGDEQEKAILADESQIRQPAEYADVNAYFQDKNIIIVMT